MKPWNQRIGLAMLGLTLALAVGCNRNKTPETAGQRVDAAIEKSAEKMEAAADKLKQQSGKAGNAIDDAAITTKIKSAFVAEPTLSALDISVETSKGVVTLSGTVGSTTAAERAAHIASTTEGVAKVNNQLVIKKS
ncbi:MAG: BON domain-containing protein [Betaproteobacteria bacterium]